MVEYVYARHDFTPEHEDEIAFRAGERIEVIEKDDLYNDGWWQVSSLYSLSVRIQYPLSPSSLPFLHWLVLMAFLRHAACWDLCLFCPTPPLIPIPFTSMSSGLWVMY